MILTKTRNPLIAGLVGQVCTRSLYWSMGHCRSKPFGLPT
jgi:hypothetical protein